MTDDAQAEATPLVPAVPHAPVRLRPQPPAPERVSPLRGAALRMALGLYTAEIDRIARTTHNATVFDFPDDRYARIRTAFDRGYTVEHGATFVLTGI